MYVRTSFFRGSVFQVPSSKFQERSPLFAPHSSRSFRFREYVHLLVHQAVYLSQEHNMECRKNSVVPPVPQNTYSRAKSTYDVSVTFYACRIYLCRECYFEVISYELWAVERNYDLLHCNATNVKRSHRTVHARTSHSHIGHIGTSVMHSRHYAVFIFFSFSQLSATSTLDLDRFSMGRPRDWTNNRYTEKSICTSIIIPVSHIVLRNRWIPKLFQK